MKPIWWSIRMKERGMHPSDASADESSAGITGPFWPWYLHLTQICGFVDFLEPDEHSQMGLILITLIFIKISIYLGLYKHNYN
jgi:hypothetical protein